MSNFGYRDGIAVMQIIFFSLYLASALLLCSRHGWGKSSGFLILITFSLLRLVGASFQLATMNFPTRSVITGAVICESIGIAPLTIMNVGLLARLNRFLPLSRQMGKKAFGIVSILSIVAISIAIKGGIEGAQATTNAGNPNVYTQIAMVIFVVVFVIAVAIFVLLCQQRELFPAGESRLLGCFAACAPFIIVRLIYGLIADFASNPAFHAYGGNTTIWLCMSVLEEILVVGIVVGVGLTLKPVPKFDAVPSGVPSEEVELGRGATKPASRTYDA